MAKITALLHTHNDAERIGRAIESLRACDEVLVVDHASTDDTVKIARQHGATVKEGVPGANHGVYAVDARHDWVLCVQPNEAASEGMEASLFEWKQRPRDKSDQRETGQEAANPHSVSFQVREETECGWKEMGAHTRLVNRTRINWPGRLPVNDPDAEVLPGHLLRFSRP